MTEVEPELALSGSNDTGLNAVESVVENKETTSAPLKPGVEPLVNTESDESRGKENIPECDIESEAKNPWKKGSNQGMQYTFFLF